MLTSRSQRKELGELLVEEGLITERQLQKAMEHSKKTGDQVQKILVAMNFVSEKDITEMVGKQMGVAFVDLDNYEVDPELARSIPEHLAQRYKVIPVAQRDNKLTLAMVDPQNVLAIDDIRLITGFDIDPVISTEESIMRAINRQFGVTDMAVVEETVKDLSATDFGGSMEVEESVDEEIALDKLKELVDEAPIVRVVNLIISQAINDKASDIHIEPDAKSV
ncbi:MAG: GspE/PulE family protein, partial [Candidatus Xenobia bacterium]